MMWAVLAAAAAQSSFYFMLDNKLDEYLQYSHVVPRVDLAKRVFLNTKSATSAER